MSFAPSIAQRIRAVEQTLSRHTHAHQAPRVVWQGLQESIEAFDVRISLFRAQTPAAVRIMAVCEPHPRPLDGVTLCELTRPMLEVTHPSAPARYRCSYGGRGGGGSWGFARALIAYCLERPTRVLCGREFQNSIAESVLKLLADQIELLRLAEWFEVQQTSITNVLGSEFFFMGIRNNPGKIKSTEGIDIVMLEEAESITADSWQVLIPTIRKAGSSIWVRFNPQAKADPTYQLMVAKQLPDTRALKMSWRDNPWLSDEFHRARAHLQEVDPDAYANVYEGEPLMHSAAQILAGKYSVQDFDEQLFWNGPYIGLDFGMVDPTAAVCCYVQEGFGPRTLYITHEAWATGCDLDRTPELLDQIPGIRRQVIRADGAWAQSVVHLKYNGFPKMEAVEKWPNSVDEGVKHLRSYDQIIIHPRCTHTIEEARLWSYKVDRLTGDVLDQVADKHNHCWDAVRYALAPLIRNVGTWSFGTL